jgi:hypothetical protein
VKLNIGTLMFFSMAVSCLVLLGILSVLIGAFG